VRGRESTHYAQGRHSANPPGLDYENNDDVNVVGKAARHSLPADFGSSSSHAYAQAAAQAAALGYSNVYAPAEPVMDPQALGFGLYTAAQAQAQQQAQQAFAGLNGGFNGINSVTGHHVVAVPTAQGTMTRMLLIDGNNHAAVQAAVVEMGSMDMSLEQGAIAGMLGDVYIAASEEMQASAALQAFTVGSGYTAAEIQEWNAWVNASAEAQKVFNFKPSSTPSHYCQHRVQDFANCNFSFRVSISQIPMSRIPISARLHGLQMTHANFIA